MFFSIEFGILFGPRIYCLLGFLGIVVCFYV